MAARRKREPTGWAKVDQPKEQARNPIDMLYAALFSTPDGMKVLRHMRDSTIERRLSPEELQSGALRDLEARRDFVRDIEQRIARGRGERIAGIRDELRSVGPEDADDRASG